MEQHREVQRGPATFVRRFQIDIAVQEKIDERVSAIVDCRSVPRDSAPFSRCALQRIPSAGLARDLTSSPAGATQFQILDDAVSISGATSSRSRSCFRVVSLANEQRS